MPTFKSTDLEMHYLVDDPRRLAVGEPVGIALPANALHFYATSTNATDKGGGTCDGSG